MKNGELCMGVWDLIPEMCIYQQGVPPKKGRYEIRMEDSELRFKIAWTADDGEERELAFNGLLDGQVHSVEDAAYSGAMYESASVNTLDSTAYAGEEIILTAQRVASANGQLMAVCQVMFIEGQKASNYQVYRRRA